MPINWFLRRLMIVGIFLWNMLIPDHKVDAQSKYFSDKSDWVRFVLGIVASIVAIILLWQAEYVMSAVYWALAVSFFVIGVTLSVSGATALSLSGMDCKREEKGGNIE